MTTRVPAAYTAERPSGWRMYRSMVGVGLVCGVLIVSVFLWTRPVIERNKAEALERAIFEVVPGAKSSAAFRLRPDGGFEAVDERGGGDDVVHAGYDGDRRLVGVAVEARGMGYQDVIRLLYGYSFTEDAIVGVRVLESKETPGLGDRIESDKSFLANFTRLDVRLTADSTEIAHPIVAVKHGKKENPWEVDGITGATISSTAVADILRRSTMFWVPRIRKGLDDLRTAG